MELIPITDVPNLHGKRVLVRASLNAPIQGGKVTNAFRLKKILPTILFLKKQGAKIILISHRSGDPSNSLRAVYERLLLDLPQMKFVEDIVGREGKKAVSKMQEGEVLFSENLRRYPEEILNESKFASKLAKLADVYVNEDFTVSHREHASIVGLPKFLPSYIGVQFKAEVNHLNHVLNPPVPFLLILAGAKPETKIPLAIKFLSIANHVFVGGSLAYYFFESAGLNLGVTRMIKRDFHLGELLKHPRLVLPIDVQVKNSRGVFTKKPQDIESGDSIYDSGKETLKVIDRIAAGARMIVWNGPLGNYEEGFRSSSEELATMLANSSAKTVIGGGDTVATISGLKLEDKFTFVSTAGGAMLDYLKDGTLVGIEAIKSSSQN